ncbi:MAG TPA: hypothetical protein VN087_05005 [Verrucomicrobiae bacterium]|nr:hypothetical protein [Verrucomicrobiae bacterium]
MSMDEQQSGNLADETTEMMSETVAHQNEELRKRRSTRIMQAVPLAVTGVDALGRPFTERTSTLIINCHGCRYQSKHYVLKNMWVTLEVPHPETGQSPRTVRGRVAWIQRPRTVRQLFQVALELETPGNTWGIAFPPPDWFAPSEAVRPSVYGSAEEVALRTSETAEIHLPLTEPEPASAPAQDNLRVFPAPASATDASLQLARHMARLMADAKQQIQTAAREVAAQAVAAERRVSMEEWEQKFSIAREQLAQQVSGAIAKIQEESDTRSRAAHSAAAEALQRELPRWIAPQLEELIRDLTQQISNRATAERTEQAQHLANAVESLRTLCQQAEESSARLRAQGEQAETQISNRAAESMREVDDLARQREVAANAHREAMSAAASEIEQQVGAALSAAYSSWRDRLNSEVEAVQARWRATLENTLAESQEKTATALDEHSRAITSRFEEEAARQADAARASMNSAATESEQRIAELQNSLREEAARQSAAVQESMSAGAAEAEQRVASAKKTLLEEAAKQAASVHESLASAAAEAEQRLAGLRNSLQEQSQWLEAALGRAAESTERLEHFSARTETAQRQALLGFESQMDDVLSLNRNELHRQSETLLEELNARIRSTFEEHCRLAISRFDQQVDSMVQPHISRTEEAIHRLAGGRSLLDAALTLQQDRIRTSADEAFAESLARFRENLGGVDQILQEAAQTVAASNLAEIETRASDLKHQTVDDLMKSAEWYEKKAQTQIQSLTEKTVEQAENQFREKAGEVSSVFASELDHSSRSFIGHTQTQMEEVVRDAFAQARALFAEAAETTTAAFTDEIQRQARQELDGFGQETQRSLGETRVQLDAARTELSEKVTAEQEAFLRQFQSSMSSAVERGVADANARVKAGMSPLLESWQSTVEAYRTEMRGIYAQLSNQAAEVHRSRLENVSNQWMLATVASLDHQSREAVASIAAKAEETLRETCAQVFAGVGEALRDRLQQIASRLTAPEPPVSDPQMTRSQTAGGGGSGT